MADNIAQIAVELELGEAAGIAGSAREAIERDPESPGVVEPFAGGWLVYARPGSFINRAAGLGMLQPVTAEDLDYVELFFHRLGEPPCVDLCPYADASLIGLLRERGYAIKKFKNVMYLRLDGSADLGQRPGDPDIARLDRSDVAAIERAALLVERGFHEGEDPDPARVTGTVRLMRQSTATTFVAMFDGQWVGGGVAARADGPAAFFAASTLPEFRRRGVQSALIRARLGWSWEQGASLATIQAAPGVATRRNAERQGFRCAYTKAEMALPAPADRSAVPGSRRPPSPTPRKPSGTGGRPP